jgi:adenylate cyclase
MPDKTQSKKVWIRAVIIAFISFVLSAFLYKAGILTGLENKSYDSRMVKTAFSVPRSDDIALIIINQESIDWALQERGWSWPWPREAYAQIIDFLSAGDVNSIAFDIIYTETSLYGKEDDVLLGEAEARSKRVIQTIFVSESDEEKKALLPVPPIHDNAAVIANVISFKDDDDMIRRARLRYEYKGKSYPSLGIAPLKLVDDTDFLENGPDSVRLRYQKSLDVYSPYSASLLLKSYDAWKAGIDLSSSRDFLSPSDFDDTYVFFALYAPGLFDICSTPVSQVYPGVGVHVTMLDNYLNDCFVKELPEYVSFIWIFILSLFAAILVTLSEQKSSKTIPLIILGFSGGIILSFAVPYLLFIPGFWLQMVAPLIAFLSSFILTLGFSYTVEGKQKRFIKSAFSQYLSPNVIDQLINDPAKLKLGGERREISIYFSDIQGFTSISESIKDPEKLIKLLNTYLTEMSNIIMESGGTIDKYEGDAIIAFWNAPISNEDHGKRAIEAAMKCQSRLDELRSDFEKTYGKTLYHRIGINTGLALVGNMGSQTRFDYTMLGDSVNLASRLEGLNKQFGTYTMCTQATKDAALQFGSNLKWRKLANVAVVGKKEPVIVYEPMTERTFEEKKNILNTFEEAYNLFYAGDFSSALPIFQKNEESDPPSLKYAQKCKELIQNPPAEWNGVWVANQK